MNGTAFHGGKADMLPTIKGVLNNVRRTASRLNVPGFRQPGPVTGGQGLAPNGPVSRRDPQLDPFAEMGLEIASNFGQGYDLFPAVYDGAAHAYRHEYINDRTLVLILSAQPGLRRYKSTLLPEDPPGKPPGNPGPLRTVSAGGVGSVDDIDGFRERLNNSSQELARLISNGPTSGPGPEGPGVLQPTDPDPRLDPPKDLLAYDWVVSSVESSWSKHLIFQNPKRADTMTSLFLDGPGNYTVRMRVFFAGNRFTEKTVSFSVQEKFIVGMGDSFASGEGNPDRSAEVSNANPSGGPICAATTASFAAGLTPNTDRDATWLEEKAHRSFQSGQVMAALALQDNYGETWNEGSGPFYTNFSFTKVTFASFARSGATIRDSLLAAQHGFSNFVGAGQIEECRRTCVGRSIDALLISIGGNDAGFVGVLEDLVKGDSFYAMTGGRVGAEPQQIRAKLDWLLGVGLPPGEKGGIEVDLETLHGAIDNLSREVPVAEVYLNGYPVDLFYVEGDGGQLRFSACDIFTTQSGLLSISAADAAMIKNAGQTLNALLKRKADEFSWHFVDVAPDFAGHGYCRGDADAMFVRAETSCREQGDFQGTMHPNYRGHTAYALRLSQNLLQHSM